MEINDITYKINRAVFEVNSVLGPGFIEKVYENALMVELKNSGWYLICPKGMTVNVWPGRPDISLRQSAWVSRLI